MNQMKGMWQNAWKSFFLLADAVFFSFFAFSVSPSLLLFCFFQVSVFLRTFVVFVRWLFFQVFLHNHLKYTYYTMSFASAPANIWFGGVINKSDYFSIISVESIMCLILATVKRWRNPSRKGERSLNVWRINLSSLFRKGIQKCSGELRKTSAGLTVC